MLNLTQVCQVQLNKGGLMKISRLIAILMVLLNTSKTSAGALAEKFEVSTRTIYRDLDTLLFAGIPIMTAQGANGGVYIEKDFKVDKTFFSINEITHLLVGLKGIESAIEDPDLIIALEKVKNLIPNNLSEDFNAAMEQISIDLHTWQGHGDIKDKLKTVRYALSKSFVITFDYINNHNTPSRRSVEPYHLLHKESSWYLEGYCLEKKAFRMFKLSRIIHLVLTDTIFIKKAFIPQENDASGWVKDKLLTIDVEFDFSILEPMVERCGEKQIKKIGETSYSAKMPMTDDAYSYNILLSFGKNIRCIGPDHIKEKFLEHIESIKRMYE